MFKTTLLMVLLSSGLIGNLNSGARRQNDWTSLRFSTSGAIPFPGDGSVTVKPDGQIEIERANLQDKPKTECRGTLTAQEITDLKNAIAQSQPDKWRMEGPNMAAAISFSLELAVTSESGGETRQKTAAWYNNTADRIPRDAKNIVAILKRARLRIEKSSCA